MEDLYSVFQQSRVGVSRVWMSFVSKQKASLGLNGLSCKTMSDNWFRWFFNLYHLL